MSYTPLASLRSLILYSIAAFSTQTQLYAQDITNLAAQNLKGKVKCVAEFQYYIDTASGKEILVDSIVTQYNEQGYCTECRQCASRCLITTYAYDTKSMLTEKAARLDDSSLMNKTIFNYKKDSAFFYAYDKTGRLIPHQSYSYCLHPTSTGNYNESEPAPKNVPVISVKLANYDQQGNWCKERVFEGKKLAAVHRRKICYY